MKKAIVIVVVILLLGVGGWFLFKGGSEGPEVEYKYAPIEQGEIVRSISANGLLVALTSVDVKSKAGGKVVRLAVEEGSAVKKGDLIATIDPEDTKALYDQASADLQAAEARATSARISADLQKRNQSNGVRDAEQALEVAKARLARAQSDAETQPKLSEADLRSAQASLAAQSESLAQLEKVTIPQTRKDTKANVDRTKAELEVARANLARQKDLFGRGFVPKSAVEQAQSAFASAQGSYDSAVQKLSTLESDLSSQLAAQMARVEQARATLEQAKANQSKVFTTKKALEEARRAVTQSEVALARAKDESLTNAVRDSDVKSATASTVRSKVSVDNARVQLDSTTVVAPRDGIVTTKYLEEGTIIPPGTSTFSQGTSLVQISDTTTMFVECAVDEADIAQVKPGQRVRIILEAYPGVKTRGKVQRIFPAATTNNNITAVKVRVQIENGSAVKLMPGMNATCEFLTLEKPNVLVAPSQAIKREGDKSFVQVKAKSGTKPEKREVKLGEQGNDGVEVVSGVQAGEHVVVAEIDLKQLRETQKKMEEAQSGGGLAGGTGPRPQNRGGASGGRTGGGAGGAARGGGGGGR